MKQIKLFLVSPKYQKTFCTFAALDFDNVDSDDEEGEESGAVKSVAEGSADGKESKEPGPSAPTGDATTSAEKSKTRSPTRKRLLKDMKDLEVRMSEGVLARLPSHQLVEMHQQLNRMMTSVVIALKSKCAASPQFSQSSQSESD